MGQDPGEIRQEIEEAREHMGETVEALAYKTDVKSRAKDSIADKRDRLKDQISGVTGRASDATPSTQDVKQGARRAAGIAQENPLGLAVGGVAVGFLVGMLVPTTRTEDEKIGPMADQVKEKARETGQEAMEHGKQVAQEVAEQARDTVKESGQEHAGQVASSAQGKAQEMRS
jgi:gas vesicle protein